MSNIQSPISKEQALDLLRQMWEIRMFEDKVYDLLGRDLIKGASHLYAGEEAVAVGAISALRAPAPTAATAIVTPWVRHWQERRKPGRSITTR